MRELICFGVPYKFIPSLTRAARKASVSQADSPCCPAHLAGDLCEEFIPRQMYAGRAARERSSVSADPNWDLATPSMRHKVTQKGGPQRKVSTFAPLGDRSVQAGHFLTGWR